MEDIIRSVLIASDPYKAVKRSLGCDSQHLFLSGSTDQMDIRQGILICSIGKAARLMAKAAADRLGDVVIGGLVIENSADESIILPPVLQVMQGDHPIPGEKSMAAGKAIQQVIRGNREQIPVLFLISGGGSSLMTIPNSGISLSDLKILNQIMLRHHLTIDEINVIRKHIDATKGGGLLRWLGSSPSLTLVLSDVLSGDLSMVASGPATPDNTTFSSALNIIESHGLQALIPQSILTYLQEGKSGLHPDTVKIDDSCAQNSRIIEIGSLRLAISAAETSLRANGWNSIVQSGWLTGTVESAAEKIANDIHEGYGALHRTVLIYGGETTVQPCGNGMGGRNTHLALLMTEVLRMYPGVSLFSLATDGVDGNSPAAGAIIDSKTYTKAMQKGIDISYHQKEYDSFSFFNKLNDVLVTGPTGTNVNDLVFVLIE